MESLQNFKKIMTKLKYITIIFSVFYVCFSCGTHNPQSEGVPFEKFTTLDGIEFTQERRDSLTSYIKNNLTTTMLILKRWKNSF